MANKTFCPIMTIGFAPPETGKRDHRVCMKDCAWYNLIEEKCNINVIAEYMENIQTHTDGIADAMIDIYEYQIPHDYPWEDHNEPIGFDETAENFNFRPGKKT